MNLDLDLLDRLAQKVDDFEDADLGDLVDLYLILSEAESDVDDLRKEVSSYLQDSTTEDQLHGEFGRVSRCTGTNYSLSMDDEDVLEDLNERGVDPFRVLAVDESRLRDVCEAEGINTEEYFDIYEYEYMRKTEFDELAVQEAREE